MLYWYRKDNKLFFSVWTFLSCMKEIRNAYKFLACKSEGNIPHWRSRCRWWDNIKMDIE